LPLLRTGLTRILQIAALLALWQVVHFFTQSVFFTSPTEVFKAFWQLSTVGDMQGITLQKNLWTSFFRVLHGFLWGLVTAVPLGVLLGLSNRAYDWLKIIIEPARFIPPLAWIPLAIIFLSGEARYAFIIWLGVFFPVLITTMSGVHSVDRSLWEVGKTFRGSTLQLIWKIVLPSIAPHIASGARLGLGTGWACIVAAEMIGGESVGIGRMIVNYGELIRLDAVVVGMIVIGLLGYALNELLLTFERYCFPWRQKVTL
jgi:ABC-type nitrate/sulfonate/bicarbonate transport system permease component